MSGFFNISKLVFNTKKLILLDIGYSERDYIFVRIQALFKRVILLTVRGIIKILKNVCLGILIINSCQPKYRAERHDF